AKGINTAERRPCNCSAISGSACSSQALPGSVELLNKSSSITSPVSKKSREPCYHCDFNRLLTWLTMLRIASGVANKALMFLILLVQIVPPQQSVAHQAVRRYTLRTARRPVKQSPPHR